MKALALALCLLLIPAAARADCRSTLGGEYAFAHGGWKLNGNPHSALAYFWIDAPSTTFSVIADINEQAANPSFLGESHSGPWNWVSDDTATTRCTMHFGYTAANLPPNTCCISEMYGIVSDDGRLISIATFDKEMMWGVAVRSGP